MTGSIYNWSTTAASNGNADGDINFAEGQAPSTVNNSARQVMGRVAEYLADNGGALAAGGSANVITVTANSAFTAYADGLTLALRITADNTAATTLNANSLGAKSVRKMVAAGETALVGAELQQDGIFLFRYSTALNSAAGGWLLLNPAIDVPNFVTLTGSQTLTNKSLTSPTLTGTPITPTATLGTNTTQVASTAFVAAAIAALSTVYQAASAVLTALAGIGTAVAGDVIYSSGAGVWARLAKGTASQALLMNAGATAPAWATLPFTKSFESSQQTLSFSGSLTLAHSLGSKPKLCLVVLQCLTAEGAYVAGDEVLLEPGYHGVNSSGIAVYPDATNVNIRFGSNNMFLMRKDTGAVFGVTNANWALVARAWA